MNTRHEVSKSIEMLWQDHGKDPLPDRIAKAAEYFEIKYGLAPEYVILPANDAAGMPTQIKLAGTPLPPGDLVVKSAKLPAGHMIVGTASVDL